MNLHILDFEKELKLLQQIFEKKSLSISERAGEIHFFEVSFQTGCTLLEIFLQKEGFLTVDIEDAINQGEQAGYISNGKIWMEALLNQEKTRVIYDEEAAAKLDRWIRDAYYPVMKGFLNILKTGIP